jgi:Cys-rich protein (TIGR01571 family)
VTQPAGGVTEGQMITVPLPTDISPNSENRSETDSFFATPEIPVGKWRDGLCDCLRFGPFHPSFVCGWCMPQLLNAQVLTRLKLNWLGLEGTEEERKNTYRNAVIVVLMYFFLSNIFSVPSPTVEVDANGNFIVTSPPPSHILVAINNVVNISFTAYTIIAMMRARKHIRHKYRIPETYCHGCEDFCCAFWCGCCTVSQMARHTADYSTQTAEWCSKDGLQNNFERSTVVIV